MSETKLEAMLDPIVRRYGLDRVEQCLRQMELSGRQRNRSKHSSRSETASGRGSAAKSSTENKKVDAIEYADRMEISSEKRSAVSDLARRFENKSFLPTYRDIVDFCEMYGIDVPASRSRAGAVPRVFKFIVRMDVDDIQGILDKGMFSGPSRLGPISDAIRHYRQHEVTTLSPVAQTAASSSPDAGADSARRRS